MIPWSYLSNICLEAKAVKCHQRWLVEVAHTWHNNNYLESIAINQSATIVFIDGCQGVGHTCPTKQWIGYWGHDTATQFHKSRKIEVKTILLNEDELLNLTSLSSCVVKWDLRWHWHQQRAATGMLWNISIQLYWWGMYIIRIYIHIIFCSTCNCRRFKCHWLQHVYHERKGLENFMKAHYTKYEIEQIGWVMHIFVTCEN